MTHWHVESGPLGKAEIARRQRIAARCGVRFVYASMPEGPKSWFEGRNMGHLFDTNTGAAIERDMKKEWL